MKGFFFRRPTDRRPEQTHEKKEKKKRKLFDNAFEGYIHFRYVFLQGNLVDFSDFGALQRHVDIDAELRRSLHSQLVEDESCCQGTKSDRLPPEMTSSDSGSD